MTDSERFWAKVLIKGEDECWEWQASINRYGKFSYSGGQLAHRFSWELHNGPIPKNLHVLHRCDNTRCVNPKHLFLGTHADNMKDKQLKGRAPGFKGSQHPMAKLTEEQVLFIYKDDRAAKYAAEEFGVSKTTVRDIKRGDIWQSLTMNVKD